jgi:hypothetical protein
VIEVVVVLLVEGQALGTTAGTGGTSEASLGRKDHAPWESRFQALDKWAPSHNMTGACYQHFVN